MPSEHRKIHFSLDEVTAAVASLVAANGISPRDKFRGLRIVEANGDIFGIITIATKVEGQTRDQPLPGTLLCAALIRLSLLGKIPMPKKAAKKLVLDGESLALQLELETTIDLNLLDTVGATKAKDPVLAEAPAVDWWVTAPSKPSTRS